MKKNFFARCSFLLLFYLCIYNLSNTASAQSAAVSGPEIKSVFINGDSIHYIDVGKGNPVVFVHGAVGDYRTFAAQMDEFAKTHRVIAYSRRFAYPNQQTINDSTRLSVDSHARDLTEFLNTLKLGPVTLYGHSYGANIALLTAIDHPELVSNLILGEPFIPSLMQHVPGGDTILNSFITKAFMPVVEAFKNNNNEEGVKALVNGVMGDSLYYNNLSQKNREVMMANFYEIKGVLSGKDNFPLIGCDDIKKIKAPVLLLKGDKSPVIFSLIIEELNRCLNNREVATLKNTSHGLEYESPAEFNKTVLAFMDKHQ
jgi:pimeloyl-ACP methyl ester carboxylesterase